MDRSPDSERHGRRERDLLSLSVFPAEQWRLAHPPALLVLRQALPTTLFLLAAIPDIADAQMAHVSTTLVLSPAHPESVRLMM
jgi:hypothetical protein